MPRTRLSLALALAALPMVWSACIIDGPGWGLDDSGVIGPGGMTGGGLPDAGGATPGAIGGDTGAGGSTAGDTAGGGSTSGGSTAGGSTAGGSTAGGSTAGGSTAGGSTAGGSTAGGSTVGGSTAGGSTAGGSTAGGSTAGGSTAGGSTAGGSTAGGSTAGGSTAGGSTAGGSEAGTGGGTGGGTAGGGTTGGTSGLDPIIPEYTGQCPEFRVGQSTVTINGTRVKLWVGAKKEGTGSFLAYFYGTGKIGSTADFMLPAAVRNDITAQGGIVYAPEEAKNTGGDCSGTGTFGIDDFVTVDQMVACAVKNWNINPKRIYATGCSAGGLTSGCLSIRRSNYIAAVMPNSGGITLNYGKLQARDRVPNVITMNGGTGDNVIVNFDDTSHYLGNAILKAGGFAVNCVHNSGHCGAPAALYQSAWQFLKDHPYGTKPSPYADGLPSGFHSTCKIFTGSNKTPFGGGI